MESVAHNLAMIAYSFLVAHSLSSTPVMLTVIGAETHSSGECTSYLLAGPFLL